MTTLAHAPPAHPAVAGSPGPVGPTAGTLLRGISWETYERLRDETDAAGQILNMTYDRGRMVPMAPLPDHETWKSLIGHLVIVLAMEARIPVRPVGNATWRRPDLARGVEADESFYVQHQPGVLDKRRIDLATDPPPDLVIEVEVTHFPLDKLSLYASLGVNEVWKYNGERLQVLLFDRSAAEPKYAAAERSAAFPLLRAQDLEPFIARAFSTDATTLLIEFRDWVAANLKKA